MRHGEHWGIRRAGYPFLEDVARRNRRAEREPSDPKGARIRMLPDDAGVGWANPHVKGRLVVDLAVNEDDVR